MIGRFSQEGTPTVGWPRSGDDCGQRWGHVEQGFVEAEKELLAAAVVSSCNGESVSLAPNLLRRNGSGKPVYETYGDLKLFN